MTSPMRDSDLVGVIATALAAAGVGVWRPDGPPYADGETAIRYRAVPAAPDRNIAITPYIASDSVQDGLALRRIQVRTRGIPGQLADADDLADDIFHALHDRYDLPGIALIQRLAGSGADLGSDDNTRQERADNYLITLDNPEAHP